MKHTYSLQLCKGPEAEAGLARSRNRKGGHVTAAVSGGRSSRRGSLRSNRGRSLRISKFVVRTMILMLSETQSYRGFLSRGVT